MADRNEKTIFILIGAPGAGKTTWAMKRPDRLINIDRMRKIVNRGWAINPSESIKSKAFQLAISKAIKYLDAGESIIWDATNLRNDRKKVISALSEYSASIIAVIFTTSLNECIERNKYRPGKIDESIVINRFNQLKKESVDLSEGFEEIIYI